MKNLVSLFLSVSLLLLSGSDMMAQRMSRAERKAMRQAELAEVKTALEADNFNLVLTRKVPKPRQAEIRYDDGRFVIRVRGDRAETFIPGVVTQGFAVFGGNVADTPVELVTFSCERLSCAKGVYTYVLKSDRGNNFEITIRASENTTAQITVVKKPMDMEKYSAEVLAPKND